MGIVREIIDKGLLDKNYPAVAPKIVLTKEHQLALNSGKCVEVLDTHYNELFYVFKEDFEKPLSKNNISLRSVNPNFELNPVRKQELDTFYKNRLGCK